MSKTIKNNGPETSLENNRREFLKSGATVVLGLGCLSLGLKAAPLIPPAPQERSATHNMLVVGEQTVYLSHLPMFAGLNKKKTDFVSPHRYQVILEATFSDGKTNLTDLYTADRNSHPTEKMYTINPALFVLPNLDPNGTALKTFRGNTIFRGHLERKNTPILGFLEIATSAPPDNGVFDVNVRRVVHFHKFIPGAAKPAQLQYILFGKTPETFLAHLIAQPPDFDQIISVKVTGRQFSDDELGNGMKVTFPGTTNSGKTRIKEKQKGSGLVELAGAGSSPVQVEVVKEFYFEEGELRVPAIFDPTPEEIRSGFPE